MRTFNNWKNIYSFIEIDCETGNEHTMTYFVDVHLIQGWSTGKNGSGTPVAKQNTLATVDSAIVVVIGSKNHIVSLPSQTYE